MTSFGMTHNLFKYLQQLVTLNNYFVEGVRPLEANLHVCMEITLDPDSQRSCGPAHNIQ